MEPFAVADITDPQEAEESSITIVKPKKVVYGNIIILIEISQIKKAPTQVQKPFAMTLEFAQKSRESPHKVEIPLLKQAAESFIPDMNNRDDVAAAESMLYSPFEKQPCDHKQVTQDILRMKEGDSKKNKSPSILLMPLKISRWSKFMYKRILQSVIPLQYQSQLSMDKM
jgi:hypothetical protein